MYGASSGVLWLTDAHIRTCVRGGELRLFKVETGRGCMKEMVDERYLWVTWGAGVGKAIVIARP